MPDVRMCLITRSSANIDLTPNLAGVTSQITEMMRAWKAVRLASTRMVKVKFRLQLWQLYVFDIVNDMHI
jgi:hypothetical protein